MRASPVRLVRALVLTMVTAALVYLAGCAPAPASQPAAPGKPAGSDNPITIGLVTEVTGPQTSTGDNQTNGIKQAIEEINGKGGVKGRQIKLQIEDDTSTPPGTVTAFNKIMSGQKPVASFVPNFANQVMAIEPNIRQAGVPVITGASGVTVTAAGNPWILRVRTNDAIMAKLASDYAVKEMGAKKPGILYVSGDMGAGAQKLLDADLKELGVPAAGTESYNGDDKDVTAQLLNLQKAGVDVVIAWAYPPDAAMVMTSVNQLGVKIKLLGSPAYAVSDALKLAKDAANGTTVITDWVASDDPAIQDWAKKIEARAKLPANFIHSVYYDGMNILAQTIDKVGTDPAALRDGLKAVKGYKGITGEYSFDDKGDGLRQAYIAQIKDGKPVMIKSIKAQ
ncbi:MAG TPA: ABC transporter substrate-binding protein [Chloroflexota bacterium]